MNGSRIFFILILFVTACSTVSKPMALKTEDIIILPGSNPASEPQLAPTPNPISTPLPTPRPGPPGPPQNLTATVYWTTTISWINDQDSRITSHRVYAKKTSDSVYSMLADVPMPTTQVDLPFEQGYWFNIYVTNYSLSSNSESAPSTAIAYWPGPTP